MKERVNFHKEVSFEYEERNENRRRKTLSRRERTRGKKWSRKRDGNE